MKSDKEAADDEKVCGFLFFKSLECDKGVACVA